MAQYVVVRTPDERRIIVPLSRFISASFENWTRRSAFKIGTVMLFVDYKAPIDTLRERLREVASSNEYWDGRVCKMEVSMIHKLELNEVLMNGNLCLGQRLQL